MKVKLKRQCSHASRASAGVTCICNVSVMSRIAARLTALTRGPRGCADFRCRACRMVRSSSAGGRALSRTSVCVARPNWATSVAARRRRHPHQADLRAVDRRGLRLERRQKPRRQRSSMYPKQPLQVARKWEHPTCIRIQTEKGHGAGGLRGQETGGETCNFSRSTNSYAARCQLRFHRNRAGWQQHHCVRTSGGYRGRGRSKRCSAPSLRH